MVLLSGPGEFLERDRVMPREYWRPERVEIEEWFEKQVQEFDVKENRSTKLMAEKWKNKYNFTEVYKIFFLKIANEL